MELTALLNSINTIQVTGQVQRQDISGIFYDSRKVKANSIFVAIKGYKLDGHKFILDAINNGAIAVILEDNYAVPDEIFMHNQTAKILVKNSRKALAEVSDAFFKHPSQKLNISAITGTNGKTTTAFLIKNILELSGIKCGLIGTIANYIGDKKIASSMTTPESVDLNELFSKMLEEGCKHAVMEVSSHSLVLNRTHKLKFFAGLFTNITSDHLDFHENLENYFQAKKILFDSLPDNSFAIYNADDSNGERIVSNCRAEKISYGCSSKSDVLISNITYDLNGTNFKIDYLGKEFNLFTPLVGEFNAYNSAAAFSLATKMGISVDTIIEGIKTVKQVPGRFEVVGKGNKKVIIDYAHTSDSMEKTLKVIRKIVGENFPVYTVFGCGGNRDKTKRPVMGKIASELSSKVIITNDNSRFEDPKEIVNDIVKGINKDNYSIIENREEAIAAAIKNSETNSVILIAGKGHEDYQDIMGTKKHFSDLETAKKYLG